MWTSALSAHSAGSHFAHQSGARYVSTPINAIATSTLSKRETRRVGCVGCVCMCVHTENINVIRSEAINTMTFQGYMARIEYSNEDQCFIGHIVGINDIVGFHGESMPNYRPPFPKLLRITWKPAKSSDALPKSLIPAGSCYASLLKFMLPLQELRRLAARASINGLRKS